MCWLSDLFTSGKIKELEAKVAQLEAKIAELEAEKATLETEKANLEAELAKYQLPTPPQALGTIDANRLSVILRNAGLSNINPGSSSYKLTSLDECRRFLRWYRDLHPYTLDDYDCNVFSLEQFATAVKWGNGEFAWGWEWASGKDPDYQFPSHGFNFVVDFNEKVYFCDELEVAAPKDDFVEVYEVESYLTVM